MSRTLLATLLLALALFAAACSSDPVDETVEGTGEAEDSVVGGAEEATDAASEAQVGDVAADPETNQTVAATDAAEATSAYDAELSLTGDAEVPGPGSEGTGTAAVTIDGGEVCIDGELTEVGAVMAGHIHTGTAEESGGVLLDLAVMTEGDGPFESCVEVDEATAATITGDPAGHYVNLHTADFPDGAVRAQLS